MLIVAVRWVVRSSATLISCVLVTTFAVNAFASSANTEDSANRYLEQIGVRRGIGVLLASEPAELAIELAERSELTLFVQHPHNERVDSIRRAVDEAGLLGTRIYVEKGAWSHIHLADSLADAIIVTDQAAAQLAPGNEELNRVVRPLGKVVVGNHVITKPYPDGVDDWTHPYHGPDNNPQSTDRLARAPYITQFLAEPYYVPFPEVTVTSAGRFFKAFGHVGYKQRDWDWVNTLVAFNGYNGTILWRRSLEDGFNIHRNTMVATPETLYLADSKSCKLIDAATGETRQEITAPADATGSVWKWMAVVDNVLYALVGAEEFRDHTIRGDRTEAGWPWRPMTPGYDRDEYGWGFGRTFFAFDLTTMSVLWQRDEEQLVDGRAVAMNGGRIYYYSHPHFLACIDARQGTRIWKNSDANLLAAIGPHERAQTARIGFTSSAYMKCGNEAIYFAGPQRPRLVAASTKNGQLMWQLPHGNYQLVLREEGLYAMGRTGPSRLVHPLTGEVIKYLRSVRGNCTRVTGTVDSIFCRGHDHAGTLRLTLPDHEPRRIALMRPDCHDGVIAANGLVYWGPWMCDCSLSLVGNICLAPAGDFSFGSEAAEAERLETAVGVSADLEKLSVAPGDWPTYRANNLRGANCSANVPAHVKQTWRHQPPVGVDLTAPVAVDGMVFFGGSDGTVRCVEAESGEVLWRSFTGGAILYPPTIDDNRLFVGSGDGWIYAYEAVTGTLLWRFRAAPVERKISSYGRLASTWPVASGILVDKGVLYAAAGIASYDGTHVYALDAASGNIRWQNNSSGHFLGDDRVTGVSVQGHLLLHKDRLYMAGGNVISPAIYDKNDGRCLNTLVDEWGGQTPPGDPDWQYSPEVRSNESLQKKWGKAPRGCELFLIEGEVTAFDRLLYSPKEYWAGRYFAGQLLQAGRDDALIRVLDNRVARVIPGPGEGPPKAAWLVDGVEQPRALAVGVNAVLVAGGRTAADGQVATPLLTAISLADGRTMWSTELSAPPAWWGVAIDRAGRIAVALQDGSILGLNVAP